MDCAEVAGSKRMCRRQKGLSEPIGMHQSDSCVYDEPSGGESRPCIGPRAGLLTPKKKRHECFATHAALSHPSQRYLAHARQAAR
jgi:hypothetical protein